MFEWFKVIKGFSVLYEFIGFKLIYNSSFKNELDMIIRHENYFNLRKNYLIAVFLLSSVAAQSQKNWVLDTWKYYFFPFRI